MDGLVAQCSARLLQQVCPWLGRRVLEQAAAGQGTQWLPQAVATTRVPDLRAFETMLPRRPFALGWVVELSLERREGVAGPKVDSEAHSAGRPEQDGAVRCALGPSQKLPKKPPALVWDNVIILKNGSRTSPFSLFLFRT